MVRRRLQSYSSTSIGCPKRYRIGSALVPSTRHQAPPYLLSRGAYLTVTKHLRNGCLNLRLVHFAAGFCNSVESEMPIHNNNQIINASGWGEAVNFLETAAGFSRWMAPRALASIMTPTRASGYVCTATEVQRTRTQTVSSSLVAQCAVIALACSLGGRSRCANNEMTAVHEAGPQVPAVVVTAIGMWGC